MYFYDQRFPASTQAVQAEPTASGEVSSTETQVAAKEADTDPAETVDAEAPDIANLLPVRSQTVEYREAYETEERYVGRVVSQRTSAIGFERNGRVAEILVDTGDKVVAGQPLAKLTTALLIAKKKTVSAQLNNSRAQYQAAEDKLNLTQRTFQRNAQLARDDTISQQRYDESAFDAKSAEAELAAAAAKINEMSALMESTDLEITLSTVYAPFDGHIVERLADEGAALEAGTPIVRVIESGALEIRAGIPTRVAATLRPGNRYQVEVGGKTIDAALTAILEEVDVNTRSVPAIFELADSSVARAGQIARIVVPRAIPARGFWVPITGLVEGRRGLWNAFALERTEHGDDIYTLTSRELKLVYNNATHAFVTGTVQSGDRLVTTGLHRLVPGQLVRAQ